MHNIDIWFLSFFFSWLSMFFKHDANVLFLDSNPNLMVPVCFFHCSCHVLPPLSDLCFPYIRGWCAMCVCVCDYMSIFILLFLSFPFLFFWIILFLFFSKEGDVLCVCVWLYVNIYFALFELYLSLLLNIFIFIFCHWSIGGSAKFPGLVCFVFVHE